MRDAIRTAVLAVVVMTATGAAADDKVSTLAQIFDRLKTCFKSPRLPRDHPGMQVAFLVTFTKTGDILGKPKIVYESEYASDDDRLLYRNAVIEALQRCSPLPFTEGLGNAAAGRPLRLRLDDRRTKST